MADSRSRKQAIVVLQVLPSSDERSMYGMYLRLQGFTPLDVETTDEALERAAEADLVVTGIHLVGSMSGLELIRRLRGEPRTRTLPILVLTACAWPSDREAALAAGANAFLTKPCAPDELASQVRKLMALHHLRPRAARAVHRTRRERTRRSR